MKFDSYKEMYDAFQFIENKTVFSKTELLKRTSTPIGAQAALINPETITNYYSLFVNDNATSANTWGTSNIGASYSVSTSISFVKTNSSYAVNINSSTASPPSLGYSGVGSIEGSMPSPSWLSTNSSGNFATNVTGYVSIQGTSLSFYINIKGSYHISPPSDPSGQAIVIHYLSAEAH